ncbi:PepSY-associated TM helix domain-containing protein [Leeuwenhoekiella parthenopeia]|uniref:PepSY domain-containing protein n=1 Tax=Leeuwenhoekiella parthenopeia TaxID=2890320 RepID=A0ABS8GSP7_9FLAO|nr:PepSY-associated TM helix domain-containing protein [Leeuwenhoekiella parthenopeia]MCC4212997.1 PepSY domain-containing protein [Leeuwenhoekiella parthenopeia]
MSTQTKRKKQAKILRQFRSIHRAMGAVLFVFFFVISISGALLGLKKNSGDLLLPKTREGTTSDLSEWLPLPTLQDKAIAVLRDSVSADLSPRLDRIDVRQEKGSVKFIFADHYYGIQLDGATGKVLHLGKRRSDVVENIHDGSIIDTYLGTEGYFKLIYTVIMGVALLLFTITGFWLWYGPKRMRKNRD